ncbi:MAG: response regulator [Thermodesulfobacteriota bacterium]
MEDRVKVLFVDDEPNILKALQRMFRKEPWELAFEESAQAVLDRFAAQGPWDIVVADHRMPGMTGVELLKQLRLRYPRTVRLVLTSYTDVEVILAAINEGAVYKFLVKTCPDTVLRETIADVVEAVRLRRENERLTAQLEAQRAEISSIDWLMDELAGRPDAGAVQATGAAEGPGPADILEALPVGVIALTPDGAVSLANPEALRLLGNPGPAGLAGLDGAELRRRLADGASFAVRHRPLAPAPGDLFAFWSA